MDNENAQPVAHGAMTIKTFCKEYGISRATTYRLIKSGDLKMRKAGGRSLILRCDAVSWVSQLPEA